jgi:hypothetical protein
MPDLISKNEYEDLYLQGYYAWSAFFPEAELDVRFFLGDQWDPLEKQKLAEQGRNSLVFNRIRSMMNALTGYQRQNRLSSVVVPREKTDQLISDIKTQLLLFVCDTDDVYNTISDVFQGGNISGANLASVYVDYSLDPQDGDIKVARDPWNSFIVDPYFTKRDLSDCNYIIRRKYIALEQAIGLLPKDEEQLEELYEYGWERDDKFTWLPYQRNAAYQSNLMTYDECYRKETIKQNMILDVETNKMMDFDGSKQQFRMLREQYPQLEMISRTKNRVRLDVLVNGRPMKSVYNNFGLEEYPFAFYSPVFIPESDQWDMKLQSLVRQLRDPQTEANKRRSQMIDILDSQMNTGFIADEDSVVNPRSLYQTGSGRVIWRKSNAKPGAIEKLQPAQIPPSMFQLSERFDQDMMEILGLNEAAMGRMESAGESGVMQMLRQSSAISNLQDVFDGLRLFQKHLSQKILALTSKWSEAKIMRITGQEVPENFFAKDANHYDISIQEGLLTTTQRQMFFRQLIDLKQLGEPIPPMLLAKAAPIQGKSEYFEEMEKFQEQQSQQAQQAQAFEQEVQKVQMDLAKSKAIEQMAGAKERFTRATSNLGLMEERESKALQNRTQATLDQVKSIKEIDSLNMRNFREGLALTEILNAQNSIEAEQNKMDDVQIAEASADLGYSDSMITNEQPQQGGM